MTWTLLVGFLAGASGGLIVGCFLGSRYTAGRACRMIDEALKRDQDDR